MAALLQISPASAPARRVSRWLGVGLLVVLIGLDYAQLLHWVQEGFAWLMAWPAQLETRRDAGEDSDTPLLLLVGLVVLAFGIGRHPSPPG